MCEKIVLFLFNGLSLITDTIRYIYNSGSDIPRVDGLYFQQLSIEPHFYSSLYGTFFSSIRRTFCRNKFKQDIVIQLTEYKHANFHMLMSNFQGFHLNNLPFTSSYFFFLQYNLLIVSLKVCSCNMMILIFINTLTFILRYFFYIFLQ